MSVKNLKLYEIFDSSSLVQRQAARDIFNKIASSQEDKIFLDFDSIEYASRSFFDELNNKSDQIRLLGKEIKFINMSENLTKLQELVVHTSKSRINFTYNSVASVETINI